jgi:hypothetical protein
VAGAKQRGSALHCQATRARLVSAKKLPPARTDCGIFITAPKTVLILAFCLAAPSGASPLIEVARCQLPRGKPHPARHSKKRRGVIAGARLFSPGATGL